MVIRTKRSVCLSMSQLKRCWGDLTGTKNLTVNRKEQVCFSFLLYGVELYTVKRYFSVIKEREESGFLLFPRGSGKSQGGRWQEKKFQEPEKRRHSKTKKILYDLMRDGTVALENYDANGAEIMAIEDISALFDQFLLYDPNIFEERL
jgi:hypothetical protein